MTDYRLRSDGSIISRAEARALSPNVSLPKVWGSHAHDALGIDPVMPSTRPAPSGPYKIVVRSGTVEDSDGNWIESWSETDMFSDNDEQTKAEQEAAHQAKVDASAAVRARASRDELLSGTDWRAGSDLTLSDEWAAYRQALRDVPEQSGFPHSINWPAEPS
tara:strand:+ start:12363 stop:12848 length:486 start_codon:yes stop_codon:yes gene_type:complete